MIKYRAIIVEDEQPARELIKTYLSKFDQIELVGEFADGFSGVKGINELKPDLLFLDIQLPKLTGFEILEIVEHRPVVIFSTAYDQFALKAFELSAVDYILKPYPSERFDQAVNKALTKLGQQNIDQNESQKVEKLLNAVDENVGILDRVVVKTGTKIKVVPVEKIIYIEAQDDYVMIYAEDSKHLKEKTMKYFETHLDADVFIRVHRSHIVNVNYITQLEHFSKESYVVILKNGVKLRVSDTGYKNLKKRLSF